MSDMAISAMYTRTRMSDTYEESLILTQISENNTRLSRTRRPVDVPLADFNEGSVREEGSLANEAGGLSANYMGICRQHSGGDDK